MTTVVNSSLSLKYIEVNNDTKAAIDFSAYDLNGLCVIPNQPIGPGSLFTYESRYGGQITGLKWKASDDGLVGYFVLAGGVTE